MRILAIDPGNRESGWVVLDGATHRPLEFGKTPNTQLLADVHARAVRFDVAVVEMVASYGMAVGAEVFETCVWIGRFVEAIAAQGVVAELVKRQPVKLHHCHSPRANDSNVRQALVDRFAYGERNFGKGTKAAPGWFFGFGADVWQAYALGVYAADRIAARASL
ncbi:MAG: hypothetical protein NVV70_17000 [Cellulomonas sp.]|nr:hypothetical protein [Cellulomonas sp.]MCR6649745.1 hypothetical protein [Cellulomonas sp.]